MTYRVEFHVAALAQLEGLPGSAFDAIVERAVKLSMSPWDAMALTPEQPEFRQTTFGAFGVMSFYVDDGHNLIRIFDVTWAG